MSARGPVFNRTSLALYTERIFLLYSVSGRAREAGAAAAAGDGQEQSSSPYRVGEDV